MEVGYIIICIFLLCAVVGYFDSESFLQEIKNSESFLQKTKNTFNLIAKDKLAFTAFVFLFLACFHYEDRCYSRDFLCVNYPYGFYTILKFVVCFYFSHNAYSIWKEKQLNSSCMLSLLFAITYNPFIKVKFEVETWVIINILSILALIIYQSKQNK